MTTNAFVNRISLQIPDADMQLITAAVQTLQDKLLPHLVDLGPDSRVKLANMGAKTVDFVSKTLSYSLSNPDMVGGLVDVDEFKIDFAAVSTLRDLQQPLTKIAHMVDSSLMLSGSEAYVAALACYNTFKTAARLSRPGAVSITEDLSERFAGQGLSKQSVPDGRRAATPVADTSSVPAIKGSVAPMTRLDMLH